MKLLTTELHMKKMNEHTRDLILALAAGILGVVFVLMII